MAALSNNLVAEVNMAQHSIGDIPSINLLEVLKILRKCLIIRGKIHNQIDNSKEDWMK